LFDAARTLLNLILPFLSISKSYGIGRRSNGPDLSNNYQSGNAIVFFKGCMPAKSSAFIPKFSTKFGC